MITSTANPQVKFVKSLLQSKYRQESGLFLAEGLKLVGQAFDSNARIEQLLYAPELLLSEYGQSLVDRALHQGINTLELGKNAFESFARKDHPQGIAAVIHQDWQDISEIVEQQFEGRSTWLAIEAIQNPGNLGSVLRSCDATKVSGVFLLPHSTDPYDPVAVKSSMGGIFTVPVYKLSYAQLVSFIKAHPLITSYGTSDKASQNCFSQSYAKNTLLFIGSEREGLSQQYVDLCQKMVAIPMYGACDSLNLSVATGIMLYAVLNQKEGSVK